MPIYIPHFENSLSFWQYVRIIRESRLNSMSNNIVFDGNCRALNRVFSSCPTRNHRICTRNTVRAYRPCYYILYEWACALAPRPLCGDIQLWLIRSSRTTGVCPQTTTIFGLVVWVPNVHEFYWVWPCVQDFVGRVVFFFSKENFVRFFPSSSNYFETDVFRTLFFF